MNKSDYELMDLYELAAAVREWLECPGKGLGSNAELKLQVVYTAWANKGYSTGPQPIAMRLCCEGCGELHIDEGEFATKPHHTHSCQFCGLTWRPAVVPTVGVKFLPGFKNDG